MSLDEAVLLHAIRTKEDQPVVRIYQWEAPALSVGANLPIREDVHARCDDAGVALVRRPTGGGAVLHHDDVTYSVVAPIEGRTVIGAYQWIASALIAGLSRLGIESQVVEHQGRDRALACFASPTGADLASGGRKVCGSAQLRRSSWFLQHGSIPLADRRSATASLIGSDRPDESTWVSGVTGDVLTRALVDGFESQWGPPTHRALHPCELELADSLPTL